MGAWDATAPSTRRLHLVCVPHAGGTATHYAGWSRWLPADVRPVPVDLPGSGTRRREQPIARWSDLVADLVDRIADAVAGPYVLFGHSLGALVAYELARCLHARGNPPVLLLVAAWNGPAAAPSHRPLHALPDPQLMRALDRLGGTPTAVLREPGLMRAYLPRLRTELRLAETHVRAPGPPLGCPIAAFVGRRDRITDVTGAVAWHQETTGLFDLTVVDGQHFFLDRPEFASAVVARLRRLLDGLPAQLPGERHSTGQKSGSA